MISKDQTVASESTLCDHASALNSPYDTPMESRHNVKRMTLMAALALIAIMSAAGCAGASEVGPAPFVMPEPATAPSAERSDFAALIWEFSDDGDEASEDDLWDLGVTVCQLFDSGGGFGDVVTLTDEQAFSPEFAIAIAIASVTYICPEHDPKITKGIDEYLA